MTFFFQLVVTGLSLGMMYALIAIGFVIIFKCSQAFNIASGQIVMLGGYLGYTFLIPLKLPVWAAIIAAIAVAVVMGLVIERLALRPLLGQPALAVVMMTIALAGVLDGVAIMGWGGEYLTYHDSPARDQPATRFGLGPAFIAPGPDRVGHRRGHPDVRLPLHQDRAGHAGHRRGRAGHPQPRHQSHHGLRARVGHRLRGGRHRRASCWAASPGCRRHCPRSG